MSLDVDTRRARLLAIRDRLDFGGGGAIEVYGGDTPPHGGAPGSTPLLVAPLGPVSFELHPTEATMTRELVAHAQSSGHPTWARWVTDGGAVIMQLPAGLPGSGLPVILTDGQDPPSLQMWVGGQVSISCTISEPA